MKISILLKIRSYLARKRLAKLVEKNRMSYEIRRYRERRAAALLGLARKVER